MEKIWITWNDSTRSRSISSCLGLELSIFDGSRNPLIRHTNAALRTVQLLIKKKPDVVVCQYSFLLLIILSIYRSVNKKTLLIADCHNKALKRSIDLPIVRSIFSKLKAWSFKNTDYVIITNSKLHPIASKLNKNLIILKDPLPDLAKDTNPIQSKKNEHLVTFVSTFASDEPHDLVIDTAKQCSNCIFYITGSPPNEFDLSILPENVVLTGFLDQVEYIRLISESDAVLSLSKEKNILQCSTYEAISLDTPCITNDTETNREAFKDAVIYTDLSKESLKNSITHALENKEKLLNNILRFKEDYKKIYSNEINPLIRVIQEFNHESSGKPDP